MIDHGNRYDESSRNNHGNIKLAKKISLKVLEMELITNNRLNCNRSDPICKTVLTTTFLNGSTPNAELSTL